LEKSGLPSNIIAFKQFDHGIQEGGVVKTGYGLFQNLQNVGLKLNEATYRSEI
jgi:hypothetical protein